jgi:predicted permease
MCVFCFYMMALVAIFFVAKILRRHSIRGWRWRQAAQAAIHAVPGLDAAILTMLAHGAGH